MNASAIIVVAVVEALLVGFASNKITAGQDDGRFAEGGQFFGDAALQSIGDRCRADGRTGSHRVFEVWNTHKGVAARRAIVDDDIGDIGQFLSAGMIGRGGRAMFHRNDCNDGQIESFGFECNIDDDLIDTAIGVDQKTVGRTEHKVTQNDLTKSLHVFEEHRLALSVRAHDEIVKGE